MDVPSDRSAQGRKTVTVLFCDLVAYTELAGSLDPEALRHLMVQLFERAAAAIEGHGGTVEKFVGDEVMAVFGVPVVHEDDAPRAVRAAVAVRECVAELDRETDVSLEVRIGLDTREVVTADPAVGNGFVSGDAVAIGKRLQQAAAPGEIVLAESTHRLVGHAVDAAPLDPLTLKGKADDDLLTQVLRRCTLARVRARQGSAAEAVELATEARQLLADAEFPQLAIFALTAAAEAASAADSGAAAERMLARAREIAEEKGAVASLTQL